jgi:hypothetical protein
LWLNVFAQDARQVVHAAVNLGAQVLAHHDGETAPAFERRGCGLTACLVDDFAALDRGQ